jgi:hypothetical protein
MKARAMVEAAGERRWGSRRQLVTSSTRVPTSIAVRDPLVESTRTSIVKEATILSTISMRSAVSDIE